MKYILGLLLLSFRNKERKDLLVIEIADGSSITGVFTQNRFCAAPVTLCKKHF